MRLLKPVLNKSGMTLLAQGTELSETWIRRIQDMEIESIHIDAPVEPAVPKEEMLEQLDKRFRNVENKPYMGLIKRSVQEHIEEMYR